MAIIEIMPGAKDEELLHKALKEERILITNDKDFGEMVWHKGAIYAGIVLLRLEFDTPKIRIR